MRQSIVGDVQGSDDDEEADASLGIAGSAAHVESPDVVA
jgi:hypothetical protein